MREIIDYLELLSKTDFIFWFLMVSFPEGIDSSEDCSIMEMIQEKCTFDKYFIDNLTGYYDGVLDENDGYIENPKTIKYQLATNDILFVEFHPGDTIYFINEKKIGCTGPDYLIRNISFEEYEKYSRNMSNIEKILLLPMVYVSQHEKEKIFSLVEKILGHIDLQGCSISNIAECIYENCSLT